MKTNDKLCNDFKVGPEICTELEAFYSGIDGIRQINRIQHAALYLFNGLTH